MKNGILTSILLILLTLPVHASLLVIKETENAIIVEYTGEPAEKGKASNLEEQPDYQKLAQLVGRTTKEFIAGEYKDPNEERWKQLAAAKQQAEQAAKASKWPGKSTSEKYE